MNTANETIENRLADTFRTVAEQTPVADRWEQLVADLAAPGPTVAETPAATNGPRPTRLRRSPRPRQQFLLVAAAVVAVLGFGGYLLANSVPDAEITAMGSEPSLVFSGETVLSADPLIVQGALGPEPAFDTSPLGTEVMFEPVTEVDDVRALIDTARAEEPGSDLELIKVTVAGRIDGDLWLTMVTDQPNRDGLGGEPTTSTLRTRSLISPSGGSAVGDVVPDNSLALIEPSDLDELRSQTGPGYTSPSGPVTLDALPSSVAVVRFVDDETQLWIRPRGGVAVFPNASFHDGELFTLEALDANGEVIVGWTTSAEVEQPGRREGATLEGPLEGPLEAGVTLAPIVGVDDEQRPIVIGPDPEAETGHVVLVLGAVWCPHCQDGLMEEVASITSVLPDARIYAVPFMSAATGGESEAGARDETWPDADVDWLYERLSVEEGTPLDAVTAIPSVIVLDETNTVVASWIGFGRADEELADVILD